jgi:multidrug efflux system membrane fusion protein
MDHLESTSSTAPDEASPSPEQPENSAPREDSPQPPDRRRTHRKKYWIWIALILVAFILFWIFSHHGQNAQPPTATTKGGRRSTGGPVTITVTTAKKGDIPVYLEAIGTVTALYTDSITAQVTGMITAVHYKEGQLVHKGDPLIDIDPRPYQAQVMQAEGALERDQNLLAQAEMDLERYREAWARNAIPHQTLQDQEKIVLQEQGTVKNDQGTLRYNQVLLGYCHITAPIDGRVGLRLVDPGNLVTANSTTTLVVITQSQPITVVATIPEDSLSDVLAQPGHGLNLPLDAWNRASTKELAVGRVISYDNQIDTTTGTIKFRALFNNRHGELYPNEFVNTRLQVQVLHDQILLPSSAIQHNGTAAFIYVIQNSMAQMRNIKTGVSEGGETVVVGVNEGEVVANSSFEKLENGSKVIVTQQALPGTSSEANTP